ncbi:MAG TPA: hypothetical protein VF476_03755 [Chitinophagaceae bacterium]
MILSQGVVGVGRNEVLLRRGGPVSLFVVGGGATDISITSD